MCLGGKTGYSGQGPEMRMNMAMFEESETISPTSAEGTVGKEVNR